MADHLAGNDMRERWKPEEVLGGEAVTEAGETTRNPPTNGKSWLFPYSPAFTKHKPV